MMGEMDDDFGDLYSDVEIQLSDAVNAISGFNQVYIEHDNKKESSSVDGRLAFELRSKKDNSMLCSEEEGENKGDRIPSGNEAGTPDLEADGDEELIVDDGSDSENDLHIVLNEDDCGMPFVPREAITDNRGVSEGSDEKDDDFVVANDANRSSNDGTLLDQPPSSCDGLEQADLCSCAEKGNGKKCYQLSQYSQYKYIRPINLEVGGSGATVSLSSPLSGKGDCDADGCNRQMVSRMPHTASSSTTIIPSVAQQGYCFSLPRYRTIFDIDIDILEWKPWRHLGANRTDFFNFGLDEESWKKYRNHMAFRAEFQHETIAPEAVAGGSCQVVEATEVPVSLENADRGGKRLEVPKGRAIQVEGGIGDRQSSMDVRRPRNRDSDVVIQISVHDSLGDSTGSSKQEGHVDDVVLEKSERRESGTDDNSNMHDSGGVHEDARSMESVDELSKRFSVSHAKDSKTCHLTRCSQPTAMPNALTRDPDGQVDEHKCDVDRHYHQKAKEHAFKDEKVTVEQTTEVVVDKIPLKEEPQILEAVSSLCYQIQGCASSSYVEGHSKASNVGMDIDMDRNMKPSKRPSSNSVTELKESVRSDSFDSESNGSELELGEWKYGSEVQSPNHVKQNCYSRMRSCHASELELGECKYGSEVQSPNHVEQNCDSQMQLCNVAELKNHRDDDETVLISYRKDRCGGDRLKVSHGTHKGMRRNNGVYDGKHLSYYRGIEVPTSHRSDRTVDRQSRNVSTENFHGIPRLFEDDMDPFLKHTSEKNSAVDRKRKDYLHERAHVNDRINSISYKETRSLSGDSSLNTKKEMNPWQRRNWDDESRFRNRTPDEELEHRCIEEPREKYGRHVPYNGREPFKEKYDRYIPYVEREIERSGTRNRYCRSPCLDLDSEWSSSGYDDEFWRHPNHRCSSVDTCREFQIVKERRWQYIASPRNDAGDSRRFDERYFDHWRQTRSEKLRVRDSRWIDPLCKYDCDAKDRSIYPDADICKERRQSSRRSEAFHWDENIRSRYRNQDDMYAEEAPFSFEKNKRHEFIHVEREQAVLTSKHQDLGPNEQGGRKIIREERISEFSSHSNSGSDIIYRGKQEQAVLRSSDSALGVWEGKFSGRLSKAGDARCSGGQRHMDRMIDNEQMIFRHSDESHIRKTVLPNRSKVASHSSSSKIEISHCYLKPSTNGEKWIDKDPDTQYHEASDLEEGQLAEEPEKKEIGAVEQKNMSGSTTGIDVKGWSVKTEDVGNKEKGFVVYDNRRILESLAKMEKRRERFKEPILPKDLGMNSKLEPVPTVETAAIKQQRPQRKRRWTGT
ncbi:uncharacterized protein LOC122091667 [Macadamia integrifolia]|uniref:uncharacterized protein LOC122091667 n=1 Tax=Macadamia integrifolia TaxID=60698 RepID=UPI001C4EA91E|nr:uncharacterized protein LOC122091667 [Macadamia integrifolia]